MSTTITTYRYPPGGSGIFALYAFFGYVALGVQGWQPAGFPVPSSHPLFTPARYIVGFIGQDILKFIALKGMWFAHSLESLYTAFICYKHGVPFFTSVRTFF